MAQPSEVTVGHIETFLQETIQQLEPDWGERSGSGPGRPRVLPALCLWGGLLVCVLRGFSSQLALWRLLSETQLWWYPRFAVSDQAVYKRLEQVESSPLAHLFVAIRDVLCERLATYAYTDLAPFATEVVALDESTLDPVMRSLPTLRSVPKGERALLGGKIAGLFDIRRQQWMKIQYRCETQQNEKVAAREMVSELPQGSLVLADLGYFGFQWFDDLTTAGLFWISRLRTKTSYTVRHVYYEQGVTFDGLIWLGAYRADRAGHVVRLVRFQVGRYTFSYVTNVLETQQLSIHQLAALYQYRWDFELAIKLVKRELKLHLLWSAKSIIIQHQLWAVLIIAQILQALRMEIAGRAQVPPFDVSMSLLVEYLPHLAAEGKDPVTFFVTRGRTARFIRPSTRTHIVAPHIPPDSIIPLPPDFELVRTPRYAHRRC